MLLFLLRMVIILINDLINQILQCKLCKDTFGIEPKPIVSGTDKSKIVQVSQAPSSNVHKSGKPFDDLSGKKLKYEWYNITDEIFYNTSNFYLTSIGHCYLGKTKNGGDRLPPSICAKKWLTKEIELVDNELYILIGSKAAKFFFPNDSFTDLVFSNNYIKHKLTIILPHPSPLNIKWFKENPMFNDRIKEIRKIIHSTLLIK